MATVDAVYVADQGANTLSAIDPSTLKVSASMAPGPSRRHPPRRPRRTASIAARVERAISVGGSACNHCSRFERNRVFHAAAGTDPAIFPSSQITSFDPTGLGAELRVAITVAI